MNWEVFDKETLLEIVKKFSENVHESINTINYLKLEVTSDIYQQFSTKSPPSSNNSLLKKSKSEKSRKQFDMSKFHQRHIALKIFYDGKKYDGFASQNDTDNTVEAKLFYALTKTCLITNRDSSHYSRCGRTDKGVSASCQTIGIYVRTNLKKGCEFVDDNKIEDDGKEIEELDYCKMLNSILPNDIRVLGWCPINLDFNARFGTKSRIYRYYFVKRNLDINLMLESSKKYIGEHDFRHFCKIDLGNVTNFVRTIIRTDFVKMRNCGESNDEKEIWYFEIEGQAFLWHQVRYLVAILFLIGSHLEEPSIIDDLLDYKNNPSIGEYTMALEYPLCLWKCNYPEDLEFTISDESYKNLITSLENKWEELSLQIAQYNDLMNELRKMKSFEVSLPCSYKDVRFNSYKPLKSRPKRSICYFYNVFSIECYEERLEELNKKRKIE